MPARSSPSPSRISAMSAPTRRTSRRSTPPRPPACAAVVLRPRSPSPPTAAPPRHLDAMAEGPRHRRHLRHRHPRADRAHPRQGHAQRGHRARSGRQVRPRGAEGARRPTCPPWTAWTSCRCDRGAALRLGRDAPGTRARATAARTAAPRHHVVAIDYGVKRNILRLLADAGCKVTVVPATATRRGHAGAEARRRVPLERPRRSGRDRRICRAGDPEAARPRKCRPSASASATRCLASPSAAKTEEDAPGPSRREPSGQGHDHRQGRDRLDEPRLRGRSATACRRTPWRRTSRCSTARIAASRSTDRPAFSVQYHPEASPGPQDSHYLFDRFVKLIEDDKAKRQG